MDFLPSALSLNDVDSVDELMKRNSKTLGFLPLEALRDFLTRGTVLGAKNSDGHLVAYLLYASYPSRIRVVHLCVSDQFRGKGIAKLLFDELQSVLTTQSVIRLNCRRDFPAHHLWPRLGFVPVDERPGRSIDGHPLTRWEYQICPEKQLDIFKEKTSNQALDVAIDAQILFHLNDASSEEADPSRALLADFLVDSIDLSITDEIFVEIDRQEDLVRRETSRQHAHTFRIVRHNRELSQQYEKSLGTILPKKTQSDLSDIRHIAKAAASDANVFVTRDDAILKQSKEIFDRTELIVTSPAKLIIQLHELVEKQTYGRSPISGQNLVWRRLTTDDIDAVLTALREPGERKSTLRQMIYPYLEHPDIYTSEVLCSFDELFAIRVHAEDADTFHVRFARSVRSKDQFIFDRFLVADSLATCVARRLSAVYFDRKYLTEKMHIHLLVTAFKVTEGGYIRPCLSLKLGRKEVLDKIAGLLPNSADQYRKMSNQELVNHCSPVGITYGEESYFMVPIRPAYAISLFDQREASADFFGGKSKVLMRWENIYYRKKTHYHMLRPPARILWYESGQIGAITAVSHLDSVETGNPKELFRKFMRFGTLEWHDLFDMCDGDPMREIMALKFSHTFLFQQPISLDRLRAIEGRRNVAPQSPRSISRELFLRIFETGYPGI